MNWITYTILTVIFLTALNLLMRVLAVNSKNPRAFSFIFNSWGALFAFLLFIIQPRQTFATPDISIILLVLLSIILYGTYERIQFYARKEIEVSTITVLFRLAPAITFISSILVLGESFSTKKLIGVILIITATILASYKKTTIKFSKALITVLICAMMLGIAWTIDKKVMSTEFSPQFYSLLIWAAPLLYIYLPRIPRQDLKTEIYTGSWKIPLLALINVLGYYFQLKATSLADVSVVIPLISVSTIFIVLGGIILLKEKSNIMNKIIAGAIVSIGVILLT
ncbi:MAG: DMT family transporter [Parcubacteria group bacterium]